MDHEPDTAQIKWPMIRRRGALIGGLIGLAMGLAWPAWQGYFFDNPLNPTTLSTRRVGPGDCLDVRRESGPVVEIARATDCATPHDAEVLTSATVNPSAASYAQGLGVVEWCREGAWLRLSILSDHADISDYRVRVASDGVDAERPESGDTVACLVERVDGKPLTGVLTE